MNDQNIPSIILIGIGDIHRQDDGVGSILIERLKPKLSASIPCIALSTDLTPLLDYFERYSTVMIVDAIWTGQHLPGTCYRFMNQIDFNIQESPAASSHGFGLQKILELAEITQALPDTLYIYGIEPKSVLYGATLSPVVESALNELEQLILKDIPCMK